MRFYSFVLVCVTFFNISTAVASTVVATSSETSRLLRTHNVDEEDRGIPVLIRGLSKVKSWFATYTAKFKFSDSEHKQLRGWLKEGKTPDDILAMLKLDDGLETFFASPNFSKWSDYIVMYNKKNELKHPEKMVNVLGVFVKTYGDEAVAKMLETAKKDTFTAQLAEKLQNDLLTAWGGNGMPIEKAYSILKVDEEGVKDLFTSPAFNVWSNYFNLLNHHNSDGDVNMMKQLLTSFDEYSLAKAIQVANKDGATELIASRLQMSLFEKWVSDGIKPNAILKRLQLGRMTWEIDPTMEIVSGYLRFYGHKVQLRPKKFQKPLVEER